MCRRRGVTQRQDIAQRVGDAVERALAGTVPAEDSPVFRHVFRELRLPPFKISKKDAGWAQARHAEFVANPDHDPNSWWPKKLREVVDTAQGLRKPEPVTAQIHVVRLGDAGFASSPFELFLDFSLRIKARSPAAQTVLVQLTSGSGGYLASERGVRAGSYGAVPSSCAVGPAGGRKLVEETLKTLNRLFTP